MDKVLELVDGKVKLREQFRTVPEFKAIYTYAYNKAKGDNEGRKRERYDKELEYIWYVYSPLSAYREYSAKELEEEVFKLTGIGPKDVSKELAAAIAKYQELAVTRLLRLIRSAEGAVDKLRDYYDTLDFKEKTSSGGLVNHPIDVIKSIGDLDKVAESLKKMTRRQKEEEGRVFSSRGEQEPGWMAEQQNDEEPYDNSGGEQ